MMHSGVPRRSLDSRLHFVALLSTYQVEVLGLNLGPVKADQDLVEDGAQDATQVRGHDRDVEPVVVGAERQDRWWNKKNYFEAKRPNFYC